MWNTHAGEKTLARKLKETAQREMACLSDASYNEHIGCTASLAVPTHFIRTRRFRQNWTRAARACVKRIAYSIVELREYVYQHFRGPRRGHTRCSRGKRFNDRAIIEDLFVLDRNFLKMTGRFYIRR